MALKSLTIALDASVPEYSSVRREYLIRRLRWVWSWLFSFIGLLVLQVSSGLLSVFSNYSSACPTSRQS